MTNNNFLNNFKKEIEAKKSLYELDLYRRDFLLEMIGKVENVDSSIIDMNCVFILDNLINCKKLTENQLLFIYSLLLDETTIVDTKNTFDTLSEDNKVKFLFPLHKLYNVSLDLIDDEKETSIIYKDEKFSSEFKQTFDNVKQGIVAIVLLKVMIGMTNIQLSSETLQKEDYDELFDLVMNNVKEVVDIEELS